jgi:hypothetical protein
MLMLNNARRPRTELSVEGAYRCLELLGTEPFRIADCSTKHRGTSPHVCAFYIIDANTSF